jgi:TPR repeat protein
MTLSAAVRVSTVGGLLVLLLAGPLGAEPFDDGLSAYERGDYAEAARWWHKAAAQGDAQAQHNLGFMYAAGQGIPQDYTEAVRWWHKAAAQGDAQAQYTLGVLYAKGLGVPQDYVQAHMWLNLAASRYSAVEAEARARAVHNRDVVAAKMTPAQIAEAQKLAREWRPK